MLFLCFVFIKINAQNVKMPTDSALQMAIQKGIHYMEKPNNDLEISVCFLYDILQKRHKKAFLNVKKAVLNGLLKPL